MRFFRCHLYYAIVRFSKQCIRNDFLIMDNHTALKTLGLESVFYNHLLRYL